MSIHKSLKITKNFGRRNVLNKIERIKLLIKQGLWKEGDRVNNLPKVKVVKLKEIKEKKKEEEKQPINFADLKK